MNKKSGLFLSLISLVILALLAMSCTKEVEVEVEKEVKSVELKVPVAFGTHLPSLGDNILYISERLESISDGSLPMTVHESGELIAANEILDAVSSGKTDADYATASY